jgi:hypothetical protein
VDGVADLVVEVPDGLQHGLHLLGPHRRGTLGPEGSRTFGWERERERERGEGRRLSRVAGEVCGGGGGGGGVSLLLVAFVAAAPCFQFSRVNFRLLFTTVTVTGLGLECVSRGVSSLHSNNDSTN